MATLYRTYRPQKFSDVAGQDHITQTLQAALIHDRLGHAYLFAGPRGVGKTTLARLLAKAINCQKKIEDRRSNVGAETAKSDLLPSTFDIRTAEPCNECSICLDITDGRSLDVIEIDAASNRGIDEMRELREKIKFAPTLAKRKVYIIDEVHMLTKEAFNALLKTLEEPPKHAVFVLATTEIHKVPVTILSRCQVFTFKKARTSDLITRLTQVAASESISIDADAIAYIANLGGGSFRDALSLLDQVSSMSASSDTSRDGSAEPLTVARVQAILGLASLDRLLGILEVVATHEPSQALALMQAAEDDGIDLDQLTNQLVETGRDLMHARLGHSQLARHDVDPARWQALVDAWPVEELLTMIRTFVDARALMKVSPIPALPLELALVRLANSEQIVNSKQPIVDDEGKEPRAKGKEQPQEVHKQAVESPPTEMSADTIADLSTDIQNTKYEIQDTASLPATPHIALQAEPAGTEHPAVEISPAAWQSLMSRLRSEHPNLHGLLERAHFGGVEAGHLVVHVPFQFAADRLSDKKHRATVEKLFAEVFGGELLLKCVVQTAKPTAPPAEMPAVADPALIDAALEMFG